MMALAVAAAVCAFGLFVLARKQRQGAIPILLAAMPLGMLLPVLPIPLVTIGMIRGFQAMSESGASGSVQAAELSLAVSRPLFWGCLAFVLVMGVAAFLQLRDEPEDADVTSIAVPDAPEPAKPQSDASLVILVGASLFALPIAGLIALAAGVPRLVMSMAVRLSPAGATPEPLDPAMLRQASEQISSRLVGSTLFGLLASLLLVAAILVILLMLRPGRSPRWVMRYSWVAVALSVLGAAWMAMVLLSDIRSYERTLSAPASAWILPPSVMHDTIT